MSEKLYHKLSEFKDKLITTRQQVFSKGMPTGFFGLDNIMSFKKGFTTVVYSPPHVGKSVITMDLLMAQAEMGKHVAIYSPEFRKKEELAQALIQCRLGKSFFGDSSHHITDEEFLEALEFVDKYFVILQKPKRKKDNSQEKMTMKTIYRLVSEAEQEYKVKFGFLFIDPFNFVDKNTEDTKMDIQDYVLDANDMMAEFSEILDLHTIISAHTKDMDLITDKESGIQYYPVAHPSLIMGGQSWFRSAYQIVTFWRCPVGVMDKEGQPYPENATDVIVQKSKPFGIGKLERYRIYFDPDTFTMYELVGNRKYYRGEYGAVNEPKTSAMQPSKSWESNDDIFNK